LWLLCYNGAGYKHSYLLTYLLTCCSKPVSQTRSALQSRKGQHITGIVTYIGFTMQRAGITPFPSRPRQSVNSYRQSLLIFFPQRVGGWLSAWSPDILATCLRPKHCYYFGLLWVDKSTTNRINGAWFNFSCNWPGACGHWMRSSEPNS